MKTKHDDAFTSIEKVIEEKCKADAEAYFNPKPPKDAIQCAIEINPVNYNKNNKEECEKAAYWIDKLWQMYRPTVLVETEVVLSVVVKMYILISPSVYKKLKSENGIHVMQGILYHHENPSISSIGKNPTQSTCYASVNVYPWRDMKTPINQEKIRLYDMDKEIITDLRTNKKTNKVGITSNKILRFKI